MSAFGVTIADKTSSSAEKPPMSKQKKQVLLLCGLLVVALPLLYWLYWPETPSEDPAVVANPEIKPVVQAAEKKDIPQLQQLAADNNPIVASRAVTALAQLGDPSVLQQAAQDRRPEVRLAAVANMQPTAKNLGTLAWFAEDPDPNVRLRSVATLAKVEEHAAFGPLLKMLEDNDPTIRQAAIRAIEVKSGFVFRDFNPSMRNPAAVAKIRNLLETSKASYEAHIREKKQAPTK
jgi:hypothetical protein